MNSIFDYLMFGFVGLGIYAAGIGLAGVFVFCFGLAIVAAHCAGEALS